MGISRRLKQGDTERRLKAADEREEIRAANEAADEKLKEMLEERADTDSKAKVALIFAKTMSPQQQMIAREAGLTLLAYAWVIAYRPEARPQW